MNPYAGARRAEATAPTRDIRRMLDEPAPQRFYRHRHQHDSLSDRGDQRHRPISRVGRSGGNRPARRRRRSHRGVSARRASSALSRCLSTIAMTVDNLGVEEIVAVGTSALRDAANSAEVRARWRDELGFDMRVISGDEEAAYSFLAVQRGLRLRRSRAICHRYRRRQHRVHPRQ